MISKNIVRIKKYTKKCIVCDGDYVGIGSSKYCTEHKNHNSILRKKLKEQSINKEVVLNPYTKIIPNNSEYVIKNIFLCEVCNQEYSIFLTPGENEVTIFCEEHRNEYKRKLYNNRK